MSAIELRIVLDANVICADPWLDRVESRVFFEGVQVIGARVFVPRVALEEALNFYAERLRENRTKLENATKEWQVAARLERQEAVSSAVLKAARHGYEEYLSKLLAERAVEILPYPQATHEELVRRALDRRKPFSQGGGYRDTLIWKAVLELLGRSPSPIWFVTRNDKDFGTGPEPAPDLVRDLEAAGLSGNAVRVYPSLADLNKERVVPHLQRRQSKAVGFPLDAWVKKNLLELLKEDRWTRALVGVEPDHVAVRKDEVRLLKLLEARVDDLRLLPSGDTLVEAYAVLDLCYPVAVDVEQLRHEDVRLAFPNLRRIESLSTYHAPVQAQVRFGLVLEGVGSRLLSADIETVQGTVGCA